MAANKVFFMALFLILPALEFHVCLQVSNFEKAKAEEAAEFETRIKTQLLATETDFASQLMSLISRPKGLDVCGLIRKQVIYLCRLILKNEAYRLTVDRTYFKKTNCQKIHFQFEHIENLENYRQYFLMVACPPIIGSSLAFYLSGTEKEELSLNIFRRKSPFGFHVIPSGQVKEIDKKDLEAVRKLAKKPPFQKPIKVYDSQDSRLVRETPKIRPKVK